MQHRSYRRFAALGLACSVALLLAAACSSNSSEFDLSPTPGASRQPAPSPTPVATAEPTLPPAPTAVPGQQQRGGMHANLPLQGEFAVVANQDDQTLSVVPIGAATVATTVQLDLAPRAVGAAPNSDTVVAADADPASHMLAVATLNSSAEAGTVDAGNRPDTLGTPPLIGTNAPVLLISDDDRSVRSLDPQTRAFGAPQPLGAGPHAVSFGRGASMLAPQVYVSNAGDGTVTVLDEKATTVQKTLQVGGRPVGVVRTIDSHVWVADADRGSVSMLDPDTGDVLETIAVGPHLTGLSATPDAHYLTLSSSDPEHALYMVDLVASMLGQDNTAVRSLTVESGVLALATGAEITRAYATTGDGHLLYWDLTTNSIAQSIGVGRNPVGLALGLVEPSGSVAVTTGAGGTGTGATGTTPAGGTGAGAAGGTGTGP